MTCIAKVHFSVFGVFKLFRQKKKEISRTGTVPKKQVTEKKGFRGVVEIRTAN